jgi:hypothetical protein
MIAPAHPEAAKTASFPMAPDPPSSSPRRVRFSHGLMIIEGRGDNSLFVD